MFYTPSLLTLLGMTIGFGSRPSASLGLSVMIVSCAPLAFTSSPHVRICHTKQSFVQQKK